MDSYDVCRELLRAESEEAVQKIVRSVPEMKDSNNWQPIDNKLNNFSTISNQASNSPKALTELMTNMVDAVLMKKCYEGDIDPYGKDAPQTMYEAVERFVMEQDQVRIRGGKLANMDPKDPFLSEFAIKNLVVGITGAKTEKDGRPCYTFVDNGEGQTGDTFESTFLSLSGIHKSRIPFVQGKYSMGSSGVLQYSGKRWFKLIVSRRYNAESDWAWTLLRKRPADADSVPVAEYFIP